MSYERQILGQRVNMPLLTKAMGVTPPPGKLRYASLLLSPHVRFAVQLTCTGARTAPQ